MSAPAPESAYLGLAVAVWTGLGTVVYVFARIALRGLRPPWRRARRPRLF